jgi:Flp pilus assembly protein TadG
MSITMLSAFGCLRRDRRGVSALEFAIVAPVMVTLMLGAYDLGNAAQRQIDLQEAVRSGGAYALNHPTDVSGIRTIVTNSLPAGWTLTNPGGVAAVACSCLNPTAGTTTGLGGCTTANFDTCTAPNDGMVVSITATMAYTTLTPFLATAIPNNSATYVTRFY